MDKSVRESVAALWELLWSDNAGPDAEYYDHIINTARSMRTVMDHGGVSVKDIADVIRGGNDNVKDAEVEAQPDTIEYLKREAEWLLMNARIPKGHIANGFLESLVSRLDQGLTPSRKQRAWLNDLLRKHKTNNE